MTTLEMEIALMGYLDVRQNIVVPNPSWGIPGLHECDLLKISALGYAVEIEIKISKADLLKDKLKWHGHNNYLIADLYFAVPEKLKEIALKEIPERAGLFIVCKKYNNYYKRWITYVDKIRKPRRRKPAIKWPLDLQLKLAKLGCMRILGLKEKLLKANSV